MATLGFAPYDPLPKCQTVFAPAHACVEHSVFPTVTDPEQRFLYVEQAYEALNAAVPLGDTRVTLATEGQVTEFNPEGRRLLPILVPDEKRDRVNVCLGYFNDAHKLVPLRQIARGRFGASTEQNCPLQANGVFTGITPLLTAMGNLRGPESLPDFPLTPATTWLQQQPDGSSITWLPCEPREWKFQEDQKPNIKDTHYDINLWKHGFVVSTTCPIHFKAPSNDYEAQTILQGLCTRPGLIAQAIAHFMSQSENDDYLKKWFKGIIVADGNPDIIYSSVLNALADPKTGLHFANMPGQGTATLECFSQCTYNVKKKDGQWKEPVRDNTRFVNNDRAHNLYRNPVTQEIRHNDPTGLVTAALACQQKAQYKPLKIVDIKGREVGDAQGDQLALHNLRNNFTVACTFTFNVFKNSAGGIHLQPEASAFRILMNGPAYGAAELDQLETYLKGAGVRQSSAGVRMDLTTPLPPAELARLKAAWAVKQARDKRPLLALTSEANKRLCLEAGASEDDLAPLPLIESEEEESAVAGE
jgi:hypothetical protein